MPAPFGAVTVLLPLYLDGLGLFDVRSWPWLVALYTIAMAALLVSTIPIYPGKLLSERIPREYVLPLFVAVAALAALLLTYPYETLTLVTLLYLAAVPLSYRRFQRKLREPSQQAVAAPEPIRIAGADGPAAEIRIGRSTPPAAADGR
jgi:CDP-diacylglycerol--serine O-phosphatidyltransferase